MRRRFIKGRRPFVFSRLQFESLEDRRLLAVLGLDVQVLSETGDVAISEPMLVGDVFRLQVRAEDIRDDPQGVISLPIDIAWPDSSEEVIAPLFDADFPEPPVFPDSIPVTDPAVTENFTLQRFVESIEPGNILGLRGGSLPLAGEGSAIGASGPEEFSVWQFQAVGAGYVDPISPELAGSMAFADGALLESVSAVPGALEVQVLAAGVKFNDENGNGVRDEGEEGISDWSIYLFRDMDGDGLIQESERVIGPEQTVTTDTDGRYEFQVGVDEPDDNNPLGATAHYVIVEGLPSTWEQTAPTTPVWDGVDPAAFGYGPYGYAIEVNVGDDNFEESYDFGNRRTEGTSSLSGFVYIDGDNDGQRDLDENGVPLELGLPGVVIHLDRSDGEGGWTEVTDVSPITTGKDGWYDFSDLEPGTYRVREDQPECFLDGQDSLGVVLDEESDNRETRGTVGDDELSDIELAAGEHAIDYNFGELGYRAACVNKRMFLTGPAVQEILSDRVGLNAVTVRGTAEDNTIVFEAVGDVLRVTVDSDAPQEFAVEDVDILAIDAGAGSDTVVLSGGTDSIAHIQPGMGVLRSSFQYGAADYSAEALNAETIVVEGGQLAVLRDSPNNDSLVVDGDTATLTMPSADLTAVAMAFDAVHALSAYSGDDDTIERVAPITLDFLLIGDWRSL